MNSSSATPPLTDNPGADYQKALDEGWLPIREVARLTGVNAVTLRAWERRYGLVVPLRTPKGHRLFSSEHVQRIQDVLTWLNRGVAVSQVKALLDNNHAPVPPVENDWQQLRQNLVQAIGKLAERQVDDLFNQAMALYPPRTLCEQLLMPLLAELEQRGRETHASEMAPQALDAPQQFGLFAAAPSAAQEALAALDKAALEAVDRGGYRVNHDFHQAGAVVGEGRIQCFRQFLRPADAPAQQPHGGGCGSKVRLVANGQVHRFAQVFEEQLLPLSDHSEEVVIENDNLHRQAETLDGAQFLHIHHKRAVAADCDYCIFWSGQLRTYGCW